jgi:hypothetical protein
MNTTPIAALSKFEVHDDALSQDTKTSQVDYNIFNSVECQPYFVCRNVAIMKTKNQE